MISSREEVEQFVEKQKVQLGLNDQEANGLLRQSMQKFEEDQETDLYQPNAELGNIAPAPTKTRASMKKSKNIQDPYLSESQTIHARPTKISRIKSLLYEFALPNEYIVEVGRREATPLLGGKFFKIGKQFLKFPAAVQTVYFTSDNANKNYQGIKIDGYACWRVNPEKPEVAARSLDMSDQDNPMGNTNRILRTICTEAIRHIIANQNIEEALTKKDEIGRSLKAQLERIEREWGISFDQVGIERVTILSSQIFEDLQQKARDELRLTAAESRMAVDQQIEKRKSEYTEEREALRCRTEKESRILKAITESEIHKVELDECAKREHDDRKAQEERKKAENEAAERAAIQKASTDKNQILRNAEVDLSKIEEELKLKKSTIALETEISIHQAENEAKTAEAVHRQNITIHQFECEIALKRLEQEQLIARSRQTTELEQQAAKFAHDLKQLQERTQTEHQIETSRLERLALEENILNSLSDNRVLGILMEKLPDIASSIDIDRYTVLSGTGDSPLLHSLSQILSILDDQGLRKLFNRSKSRANQTERADQ